MSIAKKILGGTFVGVLLSCLFHIALAGSLYYGLVFQKSAPIIAELDLSMTPLVPTVPNLGGGFSKPSTAWVIQKNKTSSSQQTMSVPETKEEVVKQENASIPCPTCLQTGNGTGKGEGEYVPAALVQRKPRWIKNFITTRDYPSIAREEGKDGRVILSLLIDEKGHVRDASLLEGSYEILNEVALHKARHAIFTPAYNSNNTPVPCKVTLPIRFELRD